MATETNKDGQLTITEIAADWDFFVSKPSHWPNKPELISLIFIPGAANDKLVVKEGSAAGPIQYEMLCASTDDARVYYYFGERSHIYIDFSDCTLSANHKVTIRRKL